MDFTTTQNSEGIYRTFYSDEDIQFTRTIVPMFVGPEEKLCKVKITATGGLIYWRGKGWPREDTRNKQLEYETRTSNHRSDKKLIANFDQEIEKQTDLINFNRETQVEVFVGPGDQLYWQAGAQFDDDDSGSVGDNGQELVETPRQFGTVTLVIFEEDAELAPDENNLRFDNLNNGI